MDKNLLSYYKEHSFFTDPGVMRSLFDQLPDDIPQLVKVVQGLLVHRVDGQIFGFDIPKDRLPEMEIRTVSGMLSRLIEINGAPLVELRPINQKLVCSCRDFALFLCAFLRHKNIPARIRIGFAHYLFGGTQDHVLTEYWDQSTEKWRLIDSRLTPEYLERLPRLQDLDIYNITVPNFYLAGEIWEKCKAGKDDPNRYGYGLIRSIKGMRHIQDRLILDLAALNKIEVLPWDLWGYMIWDLPGVAPHEPDHIALLNQVAEITVNKTDRLVQIQEIYSHPQLKLSDPIICASPVLGKYTSSVKDLLK